MLIITKSNNNSTVDPAGLILLAWSRAAGWCPEKVIVILSLVLAVMYMYLHIHRRGPKREGYQSSHLTPKERK